MSLLYCPECSHEVSANAVACPNCGHPFQPVTPSVERRVVVNPAREEGFPPWGYAVIGMAAIGVILLFVLMFRSTDDTANTNIRVAANRPVGSEPVRSTSVPSTDTTSVTVPSSAPPAVSVPSTSTSVPPTSAAPPVAPVPDRGRVVLTAKVVPSSGSPQPARGTRFYLLDKDLASILDDANVEPIEGNTLEASLGLSIVDPGRFGQFSREAMRAIAKHAKYSATTDGAGNASFADVKPDSYYIFAITRAGRGFALWNAPVSIMAGENDLNISPQSITEISRS